MFIFINLKNKNIEKINKKSINENNNINIKIYYLE